MTRYEFRMIGRMVWAATLVSMRHAEHLAMAVLALHEGDATEMVHQLHKGSLDMSRAEAEFRTCGGKSLDEGGDDGEVVA